MVIGTSHAKTVAGFKLSHNSVGSTFGFTDRYYGIWQAAAAQKVYTTLNGAATLPPRRSPSCPARRCRPPRQRTP
jgi:hypothetical protein